MPARRAWNLSSPSAKFERISLHAPSPEDNTGDSGEDLRAEKWRELVAIYLGEGIGTQSWRRDPGRWRKGE